MSLQITFTVEEINALLQVLGQLPTSSGVYPLLLNIRDQAVSQTSAEKTKDILTE